MIVVINPSGSAGRSFKGLHAYCAHDQDRARTSERVDWIDTRNVAASNPAQAWKVMAATAGAQNELKRAAGVRSGRASKDGAVMHVVLSFDKDEPTDRETMESAADGFLSQLGVDPAQMRGKSKPKRRQFADEHQVVMYAHTDTENTHLHLMVNTVHPEHGVKLPTSNNQLKAQKWALEFSKQHGTDHKTPDREENAQMRDDGEYVKANRRKSRNAYEQEQALQEASNDNAKHRDIIEQQRRKDAALALLGRNMAQLHHRAAEKLAEGHTERKAAFARRHRREIGAIKDQQRELYRPQWRELHSHQASERRTFEELESSFFGRASNMAKTVQLTAQDIGEGRSNIISRSFRILTNAGERKAYFERAQERAQSALQRQQAEDVRQATEPFKKDQIDKQAALREMYFKEREALAQSQQAERARLQQSWRDRVAERMVAFKAIEQQRAQQPTPPAPDNKPPTPQQTKEAAAVVPETRQDRIREFLKRSQTDEQDNSRDRGQDRDDDIDI